MSLSDINKQPGSSARAGYTLPVFACAAAIAALKYLRYPQALPQVAVDLVHPAQTVDIPIEQVAPLPDGAVLAITRSDPGDNLDLTRHTPVWAVVQWGGPEQTEAIVVAGGEGVGYQAQTGQAAIYAYARQLLQENLQRHLDVSEKIQVTVILPEGRILSTRTSNAAFGIIEGLSLLGTTGIAEPLSTPGQLTESQSELRQKALHCQTLVFCIGENGLQLANQLGIESTYLVKTANWLGPLLVEAAIQNIQSILLFGYHGKLLKLAGSIFHTHHHVADARLEILTAYSANLGLPTVDLQAIFTRDTAEDALLYLRTLDTQTGSNWVYQIYRAIAHAIDQRTQRYIYSHSTRDIQVGSILFDRTRRVIVASEIGTQLFQQMTPSSVLRIGCN
jgi:cobalt-precorrin-5B (C1)-methyltransferase